MNTSSQGVGVFSCYKCELVPLEHWTPESHLRGLKVSQSSIEMDLKFFSCCQGTGISVSATSQAEAKCCDLNERLSRLTSVIQSEKSNHHSPLLSDLLGKGDADDKQKSQHAPLLQAVGRWRQLHAQTFINGPRGRLIADVAAISLGVKKAPVYDTIPALTSLVWHNGLMVLAHKLGENIPNFSKWKSLIQNSKNSKKVLVMYDVRDLWEAALLDEFEQVVAFANTCQLPLWLIMRPKAKERALQEDVDQNKVNPSKIGQNKFSNAIQKKLSNYKSQSIEEWISPQGLSRLQQVCELPIQKPTNRSKPLM